MNGLPEPLVPAEVDLRGYGFMPFYGNHLLNSDFNGTRDDAAWRAGVNLWWSSWNQVPAASLPDDDGILLQRAGLGRTETKEWERIKNVALRGFVKCSDGRLYHRFLSPLAIEAYARRKAERDKKRRYREGQSPIPDLLGTGTGTDTGKGPLTERERGTERGTGTKEPPTPFILPDWIPLEAWNGFVDMRQRMRKPMTERAKALTVLELQKLKDQDARNEPGAVLDQSVRRSWQGVFALKVDGQVGQGGLHASNRGAAERFAKGGRP